MKKLLIPFLSLLSFVSIFSQEVNLEFFADGFVSPVDLQNTGDDRLFIVELQGRIEILNANGSANITPFLDITNLITEGGERGLLGLAFHPDYNSNGYFYVNYIDLNGNTQISRFNVSSGNPDLADSTSELLILSYNQPSPFHNGGCLAFGQDGYLYIASGDGGTSTNGQLLSTLLGKLLRIDVDNPTAPNNYSIPPDNPFAGSTVNAEEIWAYGLRNPWRFSIDSVNGDIWIGDVGSGDIEEIDRATSMEAGLNYGWRCYEGTNPIFPGECPNINDLTFPIAEYSSAPGTNNCAITGGYVYRGANFATFDGLYFFADYCSGLIGTVDQSGNLVEHDNYNEFWSSFGLDMNNELYILSLTGNIYKIVDENLNTEDFSTSTDVIVYPNPSSEEINITTNNQLIKSISIYSMTGSLVFFSENIDKNQYRIGTSQLDTGIYFLNIILDTEQRFVKKLVIN